MYGFEKRKSASARIYVNDVSLNILVMLRYLQNIDIKKTTKIFHNICMRQEGILLKKILEFCSGKQIYIVK